LSGGFRAHFFFWGENPQKREMHNESIAERVQELAERVAIDHGLELVHAEVAGPENKPIVRIFIDKPQGVTHEDCSEVSTHLGTILDVEDFIHASYTLEVSSPGLERGLYKRADFERFAGSEAVITLKKPLDGRKSYRGILHAPEGETIGLEFEGKEGAAMLDFTLADIDKARLVPKVDFRSRKQ